MKCKSKSKSKSMRTDIFKNRDLNGSDMNDDSYNSSQPANNNNNNNNNGNGKKIHPRRTLSSSLNLLLKSPFTMNKKSIASVSRDDDLDKKRSQRYDHLLTSAVVVHGSSAPQLLLPKIQPLSEKEIGGGTGASKIVNVRTGGGTSSSKQHLLRQLDTFLDNSTTSSTSTVTVASTSTMISTIPSEGAETEIVVRPPVLVEETESELSRSITSTEEILIASQTAAAVAAVVLEGGNVNRDSEDETLVVSSPLSVTGNSTVDDDEDNDDEQRDTHEPVDQDNHSPLSEEIRPFNDSIRTAETTGNRQISMIPDHPIGTSSNSTGLPSAIDTTPNGATAPRRKTLTWGQVEFREYESILSDNPSASSGPPVGLGWTVLSTIELPIDEYEYSFHSTNRRRSKEELIMPSFIREYRLLEFGTSRTEMKERVREMELIQKQRNQTASQYANGPFYEKLVFRSLQKTVTSLLFPSILIRRSASTSSLPSLSSLSGAEAAAVTTGGEATLITSPSQEPSSSFGSASSSELSQTKMSATTKDGTSAVGRPRYSSMA